MNKHHSHMLWLQRQFEWVVQVLFKGEALSFKEMLAIRCWGVEVRHQRAHRLKVLYSGLFSEAVKGTKLEHLLHNSKTFPGLSIYLSKWIQVHFNSVPLLINKPRYSPTKSMQAPCARGLVGEGSHCLLGRPRLEGGGGLKAQLSPPGP